MVYASLKDKERPRYHGWGEVTGFDKLEVIPPDWTDEALARARSAIASVRGGAMQPQPVTEKPCQWCSFRDACRYEREAFITVRGAAE